jgi:hypothetical protein
VYIRIYLSNDLPDIYKPDSVTMLFVYHEPRLFYGAAVNWSAVSGHRTLKIAEAVD